MVEKAVKTVFTSQEAADWLGISVNAVRLLVYKKLIPCYKSKGGRRTFFKLEDLEGYALATYVPTDSEVASKAEVRSLQ